MKDNKCYLAAQNNPSEWILADYPRIPIGLIHAMFVTNGFFFTPNKIVGKYEILSANFIITIKTIE